MVAVAHGGLRHLGDQRLCVAEQQAKDGAGPIEFLLQLLRSKAIPEARTLYDAAAGRRVASHEQ